MPDPAHPPTLILASRSPRRAQLLRDAGFAFEQAAPPFNDPPQPDQSHPGPPSALAAYLAEQKALSLHPYLQQHPKALILAADTICVTDAGQLIGTPTDRDDARRMIQQFINQTHAVVTGVALLTINMDAPLTLADETHVALGPLNSAQLDEYLDSNTWQGKAGAYNLFERQHAGWPLTVTGDPTTVVGLPMQKLLPALAKLGLKPTPQ
ncbi:MAG: Maf family protein [Phycisphaerales bacterium]